MLTSISIYSYERPLTELDLIERAIKYEPLEEIEERLSSIHDLNKIVFTHPWYETKETILEALINRKGPLLNIIELMVNRGVVITDHIVCKYAERRPHDEWPDSAEVLDFLIKKSKKVNAHDERLKYAVHYAVTACNVPGLSVLLKAGADPNALDNRGNTPVMFAYDINVINCLLAHGADVSKRNLDKETVFHVVRGWDHLKGKIVKKFLEQLAAQKPSRINLINSQTTDGDTPLHYSVKKQKFSNNHHYAIASLLVCPVIDEKLVNNQGLTPYELAKKNDHKVEGRMLHRYTIIKEMLSGKAKKQTILLPWPYEVAAIIAYYDAKNVLKKIYEDEMEAVKRSGLFD
ncbi:hypothetical protein Noda2021_11690 [Candidatus Dependentiae bacterium Noda2021]|nr:hypothetical protein Noda2021_11690 [Candidatus Dependentiae bacterium Noda2021]